MEVLLKKTKITKSIVEQSLPGSYSLFWKGNTSPYTPLGWCVVDNKGTRKMLVYDNIRNNILKLHYVSLNGGIEVFTQGVQVGDRNGDYKFPYSKHLKIKFSDVNSSITLNEEEHKINVDEVVEKIGEFLKIIEQKGQIYL